VFLLVLLLVLVTGCGLIIGMAVLRGVDSHGTFDRTGDQVIISIWIGVLIQINVLFVASLFAPLSPGVVISLTLPLLAGSLLSKKNKSAIRQLFLSPSRRTVVGVAGLTLGIAAYCSQVIVWYDSGLYHAQVVKWLSEHGLVPGLALLHGRFGFASSWFALPAMFNHGVLQDRIASLPGALCLVLLVGHFLIALARFSNQEGRGQDIFMIAASLLAIPVILVWGMPNSPSPDFPAIVLTIVTAWAMLSISGHPEKSSGPGSIVNAGMVPLILAAGAASIKLSAVPLVVIAGCFYLFFGRVSAGKIVVAGSLIMFALAPLAAAGVITSGCVFYPSSFLCLDLEWSLGAAAAKSMAEIIRDWARWGGLPPEYASPWNWIMPWLWAEKVCAALIGLSLLALTVLCFRRRTEISRRQHSYIMALGLSGTAFMLYGAPSWRFGLGYLVVLPALAVAAHGNLFSRTAGKLKTLAWSKNFGALGLAAGVLIALHIHAWPRPSYKLLSQSLTDGIVTTDENPHFNLFSPPRLWSIGYETAEETGRTFATANVMITDKVENLVYYRPESSDTCWDSPLPCAPYRLESMRLRKPARGLSGGFAKATEDGGKR
jgi:hypothetical protein